LHSELEETNEITKNTLQKEHAELTRENLERDELLSNMVETDPEFADKIKTITEKISESNSTNQLLEN
jgi:hypothetical protein